MAIDAGTKMVRYYITITPSNAPSNYPALGDTLDLTAVSFPPGMDGLITKPIGIEQLRATLDVWLKDARIEKSVDEIGEQAA